MSTGRWNRWSSRNKKERQWKNKERCKSGRKKNEGNNFCDESEKQRDIDYYFSLCRSNLGVHNFILLCLTSNWRIIRVTFRRLACSRIVCFFWILREGILSSLVEASGGQLQISTVLSLMSVSAVISNSRLKRLLDRTWGSGERNLKKKL
jgi:hypothetical protein